LVLALGVAVGLGRPAAAASDAVRVHLESTGVDADAAGNGKVNVRDRRRSMSGTLDLRVRRLVPKTTYQVTIDGIAVGTIVTKRSGSGRARFRTKRSNGRNQFLGVDPRGRTIAILDGAGTAVLGAAVGRGNLDPNAVRCCVPDDSGPECEDRTAAECTTAGGADMGPGSCLPNPCLGTPDDDIVCCLPDDSGPECEDRTPAECAAGGGINLGAGSCDPSPCTPVGGPTSTTLPAGGPPAIAVECERRADRSRASVNGKNLAAGSSRARLTSGGHTTMSALAAAAGDEIELDFDSQPDDIVSGATAIPAGFLQGTPPQATGEILDAANVVVLAATATCTEK
jgi:hypothetical protein